MSHSLANLTRSGVPKSFANPQRGPAALTSAIFSDIVRTTFFPLYHAWQTPLVFRHLRELRKLEFAPAEVIVEVQRERLAKLLAHALNTVPYYRDHVRRDGRSQVSSEDLGLFPILNKSILKAHSRQLLSDKFTEPNLMENASGGSTGKPVQFYQDRGYWEFSRASQWFVEGWWGIRPGDRTASVWGCDRDLLSQSWKERVVQEISQVRMCNAFAVTERGFADFARMLLSWRPALISGYASALELFARFLLQNPGLQYRPRAVKSTAEALSFEQRSVIEKAFQCPVYNFYGSREVNNLAAECPAHGGLHVNSLTRYIEIVDESDNPVPPGVTGRVLVTDLTNFAMPFIRYEIEDVASWSAQPCRCGRPFPLFAEVLGRSSDFISIPGGKIIHGEFFTHLFYDLPQVAQFQLRQTSLREICVEVVLQPGVSEFSGVPLRARLDAALGPEVDCQVKIVDKIQRTASGKHRFTVSTVRPRWSSLSAKGSVSN